MLDSGEDKYDSTAGLGRRRADGTVNAVYDGRERITVKWHADWETAETAKQQVLRSCCP